MSSPPSVDLTAELRTRSRSRHRKTDASVRLTAPIALSSPQIYRPLVAAFYHVYSALESGLDACAASDARVRAVRFPAVFRADAFRKDLAYYYGPDAARRIVQGEMSAATARYVREIAQAAEENPMRLIAFSHTMYSGLVFGGVYLARWCRVAFWLTGSEGTAAFDLSDTVPDRAVFKTTINAAMNGLVLSREEKEELFQARLDCFDMNETIFAELRASVAYRRRVRNAALVAVCVLLVLFALWKVL